MVKTFAPVTKVPLRPWVRIPVGAEVGGTPTVLQIEYYFGLKYLNNEFEIIFYPIYFLFYGKILEYKCLIRTRLEMTFS